MSDTNPLLKYPLDVQEKIEELRVGKNNALIITKVIESEFGNMLITNGFKVPSFTDITKYIKWAKKNRGAVLDNTTKSASDLVFSDMDSSVTQTDDEYVPDEQQTLSVNCLQEDLALSESIDLSTPKNTLEDVKKRLQLSINRLEKRRIALGNEYNDKLETTLKGYYQELAKLTHTEVKMAEELKDSDKIDVATINFVLNKLFQCVSHTVSEVVPDKKEMFFSLLQQNIKNSRSDSLKELLKEL